MKTRPPSRFFQCVFEVMKPCRFKTRLRVNGFCISCSKIHLSQVHTLSVDWITSHIAEKVQTMGKCLHRHSFIFRGFIELFETDIVYHFPKKFWKFPNGKCAYYLQFFNAILELWSGRTGYCTLHNLEPSLKKLAILNSFYFTHLKKEIFTII